MASPDRSASGHGAQAIERLHQQLQDSLRALVTSDDWRQALEVAARFHEYSFANTQLIWAQATGRGFTPTRVAGYRAWQKLERQVRQRERGIQILAPVTRTVGEDNGGEERVVVGFRVVHVFDVSQTDGQPLPEIRPAVLQGDLPAQWGKVGELIRSAEFGLEVADTVRLGEANGVTDWRDRAVVVRKSMPGAQRFKTAVHELAHIRLHEPASGDRPNCRGVVEVEAESVAYMVCAALGVDSAGYSLPYVAAWAGGDLQKVSETADRVIRCARQVISEIETDRPLERDQSKSVATSRETPNGVGLAADDRSSGSRISATEHLDILEAAVSFYQDQLRQDDQALAFLRERGISDESVQRWQLGYAPPRWDSLVKALRMTGVTEEVLVESGVAGRARTGRLYDRMRGRIIFPIHDDQGSPRGFAGRLINGDGPKYLNSPETSLYKKSERLYGLHLAAGAITDADEAVVVEGYTDAIAAHHAGIVRTVATGGTALTIQHLGILRPTSKVTLAFDGDQAGLQAAERLAGLPAETLGGLSLRVARLPVGADPAGLVSEGRADILEAALDNPTPLLHHLVEETLGRYDLNEVEAPARALYALAPLIDRLSSPTERPTVVRYLAGLLGREENYVLQALIEYSRTDASRRRPDITRALT